jgi:hypothetical protein
MEHANSRAAARRASERFHAAHIVALCPAIADERLVRSLLRRYAVDESRAVCMCRAAAARELANEDVPALPVCARWAEMCAHLQLHTNPDVADVLGRTKRPAVAFAGRVCRSEARVGPAGALDFENESFLSVYSTLADTLRQKQLVVRADEETDSMDTFALQRDHRPVRRLAARRSVDRAAGGAPGYWRHSGRTESFGRGCGGTTRRGRARARESGGDSAWRGLGRGVARVAECRL